MKRKNNSFFTIKNFVFLFAAYVILLALRINNGNFFLSDSYEYIEVAQNIANGNFFVGNNEALSKRPFLYPLFLLLSFGFNPYIIVFLQAILLFLTFFIFGKILDHLKIAADNKLLFLIVLTPSIFIYSQLIMADILACLLMLILFYFLMVDFSIKKIKYVQITLLLLAFTKPVFYPFILISTILLGYYCFKKKQFTFWILVPALTLLLYLNYNEKKFGYRHFSSIENVNLINYNLYYYKSFTHSKAEADHWINEINEKVETKGFAQKNNILDQVVKKEISDNLLGYSTYHFLTGIRGILDPGRFDLMTLLKKEDGQQGFLEVVNGNKPIKTLLSNFTPLIFIFCLFIFMALLIKYYYFIRYFLGKKLYFNEAYFLILISYVILITGPVNCSRYMMPLQLIIIIFALKSIQSNPDAGKN